MTTTISDAVNAIVPILVTGWESTRDTQNVIHVIIGRPSVDVTYRPAGLRSGTLEALCATLDDALQLEELLARPVPFTLEDSDMPVVNMTFVLAGPVDVRLDPDTRKETTVAFAFQQVTL